MKNKLKSNLGVLLGFIVPFIILGAIFIGKEIVPFGDNMYLRSDMYHQYAPFYKELYHKLTTGGSLEFSWNIGMGVNFTAIYAYYLASPINLLLGLLPEQYIIHAMDFLILFKTALAGMSFSYYLSKHFNTKSSLTGAAGIFYALSSYMAAFSWNIMWLDCVVLLPLILLGLENLVKNNKYKMYTISLGIAIFTNYYISIMICIFLIIYFIYLMIVNHFTADRKIFIKKCGQFALFSLIAGGIGAIMFIPELYALGYTVSGDFSFPEGWINYFSILEMLSRSLVSVPVSIFDAHSPNIYCTVAVFLLIPLYCMCEKIPKNERIGKVFILAIFLISFNTNIPNYIWHGFHFPNSLPARQSFIYIFMILTMSYEVITHIKIFTTKQMYGTLAGTIGVILLIEQLFVDDDYNFTIIYTSIILILLYFAIMLSYMNGKLKRNMLVYLVFVTCIAEATINCDHEDSYKTSTYSAYVNDNEALENLLSTVRETDKDFYRVEKLNRRTKNDAAWSNYKGVSIFSSMTNGNLTDFLGSLGFEKSTNAYSYYGSTPFTSALLNVKYVFSDEYLEDDKWMTLVDSDEGQSRYIYRLNYCLPLGFMVPSSIRSDWKVSGNNPFAIQNALAEITTANSDMFEYIPASTFDTTCSFTLDEDSDVYVYTTTYVDNIHYTAYDQDDNELGSDSFSGLNHRQICHFGEYPAGTRIEVDTDDSDATTLQLYAYSLNHEVFQNVYESLNSQGLKATSYDDTSIKGTIEAKTDGLLYTSIVYDKGWSAYVDGKKVNISSLNDALITVPISAGKHTIEFKYTTDGLLKGSILTILSVILFVVIIVLEKKKLFVFKEKPVSPTPDTEEISKKHK